MLRAIAAVSLSGVLLAAAPTGNTGWLASGHPRFEVMFDYRVKPDCTSDCVRWAMLLRYQSSAPATPPEIAEWESFIEAGCVDVLLPGKSSFACRVPGAESEHTRDGRRTAMSRFHVTREQLNDLLTPGAAVRAGTITLQLPPASRSALHAFLLQ